MQRCTKCGDAADSVRRDATCELTPAVGFKSPCLINERREREAQRADPSLIPIKTQSKRKKEKQRNGHKGA